MSETTFNYRVVRRSEGEKHWLTIHEVYYRDRKVWMWTEERGPSGTTLAELKLELEMMLEALEQPVLDWEEMPGPGELSERGKAVEG